MTKMNRKRGIGIVAGAEIIKGATDGQALAVVLAHFPDARTTLDCIRWYCCRLKKAGFDVPTAAEARRKPNLRLVG